MLSKKNVFWVENVYIIFKCKDIKFEILSIDRLEFKVKKEGFGGGGTKQVKVMNGQDDRPICKIAGKVMTVCIAAGLPKESSKASILIEINIQCASLKLMIGWCFLSKVHGYFYFKSFSF